MAGFTFGRLGPPGHWQPSRQVRLVLPQRSTPSRRAPPYGDPVCQLHLQCPPRSWTASAGRCRACSPSAAPSSSLPAPRGLADCMDALTQAAARSTSFTFARDAAGLPAGAKQQRAASRLAATVSPRSATVGWWRCGMSRAPVGCLMATATRVRSGGIRQGSCLAVLNSLLWKLLRGRTDWAATLLLSGGLRWSAHSRTHLAPAFRL
jgi:hypothetical protein